jgi:hypothetical protein
MRHYQVRDVMTAGPMTVTPSTPIKEVASMLVGLQVGALPVVTPRDGVTGAVTETDLLRKEQLQQDPDGSHSAHLPTGTPGHRHRGDRRGNHESAPGHRAAPKLDIVGDVLPRYLGTNPVMVDVEVTDGVVQLTGELERKSMLAAVRPAVRAVDGVIDVVGRLGYAIDDTERLPQPDEPETAHSPVAARRLT